MKNKLRFHIRRLAEKPTGFFLGVLVDFPINSIDLKKLLKYKEVKITFGFLLFAVDFIYSYDYKFLDNYISSIEDDLPGVP